MRIFKYLNIFMGLLALLGCAARPARAQFLGYTSPQTVQQTLAPAGTPCTGVIQSFTPSNLGQTQHTVTASGSGQPSLRVTVIGIDTSGNQTQISDTLYAGTAATTLQSSGSFPKMQVQVLCGSALGTFQLTYSGASSTQILPVGMNLQSQIDKPMAIGAAANTSSSFGFVMPYGYSSGTLFFGFTGVNGPAGSSLQLVCTGSGIASTVQNLNLAVTVGLAQAFPIGPVPCLNAVATYTSGGASTALYTLEFIANPPGTAGSNSSALNLSAPINVLPTITEKGARWTQLSAPAAGTQGTTSKTAGSTGVRHVADCVSYSAGAIAAPAATTLTINLRDGATGAGTVIWTKTVTIPATAAPHYDNNFCGLNLIGTAATAMTLEFSASLASESESVTLTGYDVQ